MREVKTMIKVTHDCKTPYADEFHLLCVLLTSLQRRGMPGLDGPRLHRQDERLDHPL